MDMQILLKALKAYYGHNNFSVSKKEEVYTVHMQGKKINVTDLDITEQYAKYELLQVEIDRKMQCRKEIRQLYSLEDELKILRKAITSTESEYIKYDTDIENIISESKAIDFQIKKEDKNDGIIRTD